MAVKRLIALLIGTALVTGLAGVALAQTPTQPAPADKKMDKSSDMKADKGKKMMMSHTASGTVKSATADSIVVSGKDKGKDAEWTFAIDPKTKVRKAGKELMAKDITAGDTVTVRYMDHDGKMTASSIMIRSPKKQAAEKK